ncbi:MAG: cation:proton antiporter [Methylobacteriaceae bacterium]|nr:cation:proton antiporter [Methylobacteriaceae bacterium]
MKLRTPLLAPASAGPFLFLLLAACLACLGFVAADAALAADAPRSGGSEGLFVAELLALLLAGRLLGELMQRIGQPAVMGQLLAGLLLGPSVLGAIWPQAQHAIFPPNGEQKAMVMGIAQLGVLMLLLLTGMETDLGLARKAGRAAVSASICGILVPFACGFTLGEFLPQSLLAKPDQRLVTALLLGTALSISSVKIVAMVVREMNFLRRNIGQVIVASAIIDDTIGWIIIAVTLSLAEHGTVDLRSVATSVLGTALFLVVSFTLGRRFVFLLLRWTNDTFLSEVPVITATLVVMGTMALITDSIGVSTVLGAFVAGILVGQSPILTRHIDAELRGLITALFMPVFFGLSGLSADLRVLGNTSMLSIFGLLILIASVGKFGGAFLGGWFGGLTQRESLALACGMNARGSTEVIVASIGLSMGVLSQDVFTMIVGMAVVTTLAMPPMLRWALGRLPLGEDERRRLEREALDARRFVANLERLLLAVDDSARGKFAARVAGLLAGSKGMPVTVVNLGEAREAQDRPETAVKAAASGSNPAAATADEARPEVAVTTRTQTEPPEEAVASAVKRGHDLMVIGLERATAAEGGFHEDIVRAASGFEGPLAIAVANGVHLRAPLEAGLDILVPVTAASASRRGADVALALARAMGVPVTVLHVARTRIASAVRRVSPRSPRADDAVLKDITRLAEGFGVTVRTAVRVHVAPEDAILREANVGGHNLIVMGVSRRSGEPLSFGEVAAAVLERADRSLLFVATGD